MCHIMQNRWVEWINGKYSGEIIQGLPVRFRSQGQEGRAIKRCISCAI